MLSMVVVVVVVVVVVAAAAAAWVILRRRELPTFARTYLAHSRTQEVQSPSEIPTQKISGFVVADAVEFALCDA